MATTAPVSTSKGSYHCIVNTTADIVRMQSWPAEKKRWCCKHALVGCPEMFDCHAGFTGQWPARKAAWCCRQRGLGCPTTSTTPTATATSTTTLSSTTTTGTTRTSTSTSTTAAASTTPAPYDCLAAYDRWQAAWPDAKKAWCCRHEARGCPLQASTLAPWNCFTAAPPWTPEKTAWCCKNKGLGCATPRPATLQQ